MIVFLNVFLNNGGPLTIIMLVYFMTLYIILRVLNQEFRNRHQRSVKVIMKDNVSKVLLFYHKVLKQVDTKKIVITSQLHTISFGSIFIISKFITF